MFRSLSFLLTGSQEGYMTVKTLLTRFESQNESKFKGLLIPGPNKPTTMQDHIKKLILQPQSWGTQIELAAMATFVQVPVFYCIHFEFGYRWERIKPLGPPDLFRYPFMVEEEEALFTRRLTHFELHFTGNHYNPVVLESDELATTAPPLCMNDYVEIIID